jgi:hypothetical protein
MTADDTTKPRGFAWILAAFFVCSIGGGLLMKWLNLGWIGALVFMLLMLAMTAALVTSVNRVAAKSGCASPAMLRYNRRMMWSSLAYMISLFAAATIYNAHRIDGLLLWLVALAPAAAVLAMVWAMGRLLVEETDEYLRFRMVKQALFACGGMLAISTVWGFLEMFELVVHVPAWASVPVFAIMLGIGQCFRWVRT